ncbi:TPA: hypothetical protein ACT6G6_000393 [Neisseria meningitidis]|nr:hypothetical protein [Neisseria meningitidis]MCV6781133.1 hypothetical protein [Neisseria meningitidis]
MLKQHRLFSDVDGCSRLPEPYSGLTKTSTALPRLSSKRTIL